MSFGRFGGLNGLTETVLRIRVQRLEEQVAKLTGVKHDLAAEAYALIERGQPVNRAQAAAFLQVSTKKVQRMDAKGTLRRLPNMDGVVLYAARDVLGLASASSRKGA